jgi:hypothetical protein
MDNDSFDAGKRAAAAELQPLVDAITDAIFMFNDIAKARQLPATAQAVQQYVATGKHFRPCWPPITSYWPEITKGRIDL